jgi:hypothetical protein
MPELTAAYRRANLALRAVTVRDLQRVWPLLRWHELDASFPNLLAGVSALVERDRQRAQAVSGAYLDAARQAQGAGGRATLVAVPPLPADQLAASLHATTVAPVKRAASAGVPEEQAMANGFAQASGSVSRLVLDAGRAAVLASVRADDARWARVASGGACRFCLDLAGRGAVYTSDTADFRSHDHCVCSAEPAYTVARFARVA